ncbi:MAG: hypothetical protein HQL90_15380 [Magnetococcales bacterium]|nr:hypothetical protein [Magnetococcales bacterium]
MSRWWCVSVLFPVALGGRDAFKSVVVLFAGALSRREAFESLLVCSVTIAPDGREVFESLVVGVVSPSHWPDERHLSGKPAKGLARRWQEGVESGNTLPNFPDSCKMAKSAIRYGTFA